IRTFFAKSSRWRAVLLVAIASAWVPVHLRGQAHAAGSPQIHGIVAGSDLTRTSDNQPGAAVAAHYQHARIWADSNNSGACDPGEPATTSDGSGAFVVSDSGGSPLVADISASATINGHRVDRHLMLRALVDRGSKSLVISPLTTEVVRMMEADG